MSYADAYAAGLRDLAGLMLSGDARGAVLLDAADLIERQAEAISKARAAFALIWPNGAACEHRHAAEGFRALDAVMEGGR